MLMLATETQLQRVLRGKLVGISFVEQHLRFPQVSPNMLNRFL